MKFDQLFKFCPVCGSGDFHLQNVKSKKCVSCGFTFYVNPAAAVAGFIVNEKQELLVCVRAHEPAKGTWDLPGGFVDEHESAEEALHREIREELHADVETARILFTLPNEYLYSGWTTPTLDIFFSCELAENQNITASDDVSDVFYVPLKDVDPEKFGLTSIRQAIGKFIHINQ